MSLGNNIQNGGLICKEASTLIVGQVAQGRGMTYFEMVTDITQEEVMPWFMNADEIRHEIYYSNMLDRQALYRVDLESKINEVLLKEPVTLLQKHQDRLYFRNENNHYLYSFGLQGKEVKRLIEDDVVTFNIAGERIWYATNQGIFTCSLDGIEKEKVGKERAIRIVCNNNQIAFVDADKAYQVGYMSQFGGETKYLPNSVTTHIYLEEQYLFYSKTLEDGPLYRYSIEDGLEIKFVPEPTSYLHIEGQTLYYFNLDEKQWKKAPIRGGRALPLVRG